MKLMSDQLFNYLGGINCYRNTPKIYQRPPKATKRSIKAVFRILNMVGCKKSFSISAVHKLVTSHSKNSSKVKKGDKRPLKATQNH